MIFSWVVKRSVVATAVALLVCIVNAGSASAHSSIVATNPQPNAVLDRAPSSIDFAFDQEVSGHWLPVITLSDSVGRNLEISVPAVNKSFVTVQVRSKLEPGAYTVTYGVDSAAGESVAGEFTFSVAELGSEGTSQPVEGQRRTGDPSASDLVLADVSTPTHIGSDGLKCAWLWGSMAFAIVVLATGIGMYRVISARKNR